MAKSYLGADGVAHIQQPAQGPVQVKPYAQSARWKYNRMCEQEERELCLNCKQLRCTGTCNELAALQRLQKQRKKEMMEAMANAQV